MALFPRCYSFWWKTSSKILKHCPRGMLLKPFWYHLKTESGMVSCPPFWISFEPPAQRHWPHSPQNHQMLLGKSFCVPYCNTTYGKFLSFESLFHNTHVNHVVSWAWIEIMDNPLLYDLGKKASFERHHITDELPCSEIGKFLFSKREFLKIEETKATLGMSSHQLLSDPVQEEEEDEKNSWTIFYSYPALRDSTLRVERVIWMESKKT